MTMLTRRSFLGSIAALIAAAPFVGTAQAEPDEAPDFDEPLGKPMTHQQLAEAFRARQLGYITYPELLAIAGFSEDRIADARADGYRDGYEQATDRAASRVAEGLPI